MVLSREYLFYKSLLKSSYIKGANTLEGIMQNEAQASDLISNATAMTVVFEPMTHGGRRLLPDVFFSAGKYVGAGLRTYVRAIEPDFDGGGVLTPIQTIDGIASGAEAMEVITGSPAAMAAVAGSGVAMKKLITSNIWVEKVLEGDGFTKAVADSIPAMAAIAEKPEIIAEIVSSSSTMTVIAESSTAAAFIIDNAEFRKRLFLSETVMTILADSEVAMNTIFGNYTYAYIALGNVSFAGVLVSSPVAMRVFADSEFVSLALTYTYGNNSMEVRPLFLASETAMRAIAANSNAVTVYIGILASGSGGSNSRTEFFASETAVLAFAESEVAAPLLAASATVMTYMVSDSSAMTAVARSRNFLLAVAADTKAMNYIEKNAVAKNALAESPLRKTLSKVPINATWTSRHTGKIWLVSFKHTLASGTGNHLHGNRLYDGSQTSNARADAYNTALRMDCFMDGISNQTSAAAVNTTTCEYVYIPLEE